MNRYFPREALINSLSDFILVFFIQCKESVDANSKLFKETDDAALDKNTYEIRFCEWISASLYYTWFKLAVIACEYSETHPCKMHHYGLK